MLQSRKRSAGTDRWNSSIAGAISKRALRSASQVSGLKIFEVLLLLSTLLLWLCGLVSDVRDDRPGYACHMDVLSGVMFALPAGGIDLRGGKLHVRKIR